MSTSPGGSRPDSVTDVIIVGAGPVGLCTAVLLSAFGVDRILVVERHSAAYPLPRAVHLDAEVFRILQSAGVASAFRRISRPASGLRLVDRALNVFAQFDRTVDDDAGIPEANMFDQPELERLLRDRVDRMPNIVLAEGIEFLGASETEDWVRVEVRNRATGARESHQGAYLVGADGAASRVREVIGAAMIDRGFRQRWLVVDVDISGAVDTWDGVDQVFDGDRPGTYMRVTGDRHRWEFRLRPGETSADFSSVRELRALIAPWLPDVRDEEISIVRCAEYEFHARVADRWRLGRTFLTGDAAHLTPPFIGQGLGSGLRDAANLSWKLASVLRTGSARILATYEDERRPHSTAMIRRAVLIGVAMTNTASFGRLLREAILPRAHRFPGVGQLASSAATPRLRRSALVRTRFAGRLRGRLASPQIFDNASTTGYGLMIGAAGRPFILVRPDGVIAVAARTPSGFFRRLRRYARVAHGARVARSSTPDGPGRWVAEAERLLSTPVHRVPAVATSSPEPTHQHPPQCAPVRTRTRAAGSATRKEDHHVSEECARRRPQ
ncbi:bifunctional 3-(3-hydroxy-phenyl)propionate/3-hydroxycinnamic acid hydroxylase [Brevibacterium sp. 2SA]|uniref:bifunctional 3-(3-hydroxy-phenyl)propionate/3-hydroxycinnamic acid hydroxylase n=1 Tax=Brevibacterium sp. 2SA TaxID=2502198 RepID=UPI0014858716|nr:bifunctional 3-(3-hydroxy-phenyl)propionate/3-hydroxycinnamic acid hydroxylase [Brevibacterium sp. 2SA]